MRSFAICARLPAACIRISPISVNLQEWLTRFLHYCYRNAYLFQSFVFTTRFLQQNAAASKSKASLLLMERSVLTDRCVFVETATEEGYFNPLEAAAYDAWYDGVVTTLPNVVCIRYKNGLFVWKRPNPHSSILWEWLLILYFMQRVCIWVCKGQELLFRIWESWCVCEQVPDAFVYLRADPSVCYERLKAR